MLHSGHPATGRQRLVQGVLGRRRSEGLAIAGTEALDTVLVQQRLGRRHQSEGVRLVGRSLVGGIEQSKAVDLIAEEVEPERLLRARREQVDQRPAHGIFAMFRHRIRSLVAERVQLFDQGLALDPIAHGHAPSELADPEGRQRPLSRRARGRDQQLRLLKLRLKRAQSAEPLGHHPQSR